MDESCLVTKSTEHQVTGKVGSHSIVGVCGGALVAESCQLCQVGGERARKMNGCRLLLFPQFEADTP